MLDLLLLYYWEDTSSSYESVLDKGIFENNCTDNGINSMVIGNDSVMPAVRTSNEYNINRQKGLYLRDNQTKKEFFRNLCLYH